MRAFDLGDVEEARGVTDEGAARESAARNRLEAAFVERACAIGDAAAAGEDRCEEGVMLHALKFAVGGEIWVGVVLQGGEMVRMWWVVRRGGRDLQVRRRARVILCFRQNGTSSSRRRY